MTDYCDCDNPCCEQEHKPLSPAQQASVDLKVKVQDLGTRGIQMNGLASELQFAIGVQLWGILHEVMRDGIETGRLIEREDAVGWLRSEPHVGYQDGHTIALVADALEELRHLPTPNEKDEWF